MWFFDLPDADEKQAIWLIQMNRFGVCGAIPDDTGWSSSDIRDCCRTASLRGTSIIEAAKWVRPAMHREPERIESLRSMANGKMNSASRSGAYRIAIKNAPGVSRSVNL
jgi:hypothetical protein